MTGQYLHIIDGMTGHDMRLTRANCVVIPEVTMLVRHKAKHIWYSVRRFDLHKVHMAPVIYFKIKSIRKKKVVNTADFVVSKRRRAAKPKAKEPAAVSQQTNCKNNAPAAAEVSVTSTVAEASATSTAEAASATTDIPDVCIMEPCTCKSDGDKKTIATVKQQVDNTNINLVAPHSHSPSHSYSHSHSH